jgi:hypothetical protein
MAAFLQFLRVFFENDDGEQEGLVLDPEDDEDDEDDELDDELRP